MEAVAAAAAVADPLLAAALPVGQPHPQMSPVFVLVVMLVVVLLLVVVVMVTCVGPSSSLEQHPSSSQPSPGFSIASFHASSLPSSLPFCPMFLSLP